MRGQETSIWPIVLCSFLSEKENQTWNLQRAKNLQVTIVPSIKGQFWLLLLSH